MNHRGALVCLPQDEWIQPLMNTPLLWGDVVYDTDSCFDPNYPDRLYVPAGVCYAKVNASVVWAYDIEGERQIVSRKGPSALFYKGGIVDNMKAIGGTTCDHGRASAWVPVVEGDFFSILLWHSASNEIKIPQGTGTWFEIEFK